MMLIIKQNYQIFLYSFETTTFHLYNLLKFALHGIIIIIIAYRDDRQLGYRKYFSTKYKLLISTGNS